MVSTRKKRQPNRRFLSQLDDFDHDTIIATPLVKDEKMLWSVKALMSEILLLVLLALIELLMEMQ